jgi:transposase
MGPDPRSNAFACSLEPVAFTGSLNKLKHFRAIATRYDKRDYNYLASVQLASIRIWLRTYESVT